MTTLKKTLISAALSTSLLISLPTWADDISSKSIMKTYVDIAHAGFSDSLTTAKTLKTSIDAFVLNPSKKTHQAAKEAWRTARIPYGQTEVFRFGNPNVDDWEGKVNAWPLDEGLIDYVSQEYEHEDGNQFATANIIAGQDKIDRALLESYHEKGGSEANVTTGYHAIEFLLWGQDLNENPGDAGSRAYTDYAKGDACTHDHCERRGQYLVTATDLLVKNLEEMVADWQEGDDNYRATFLALDEKEALRRMLFGMGSLSLGELAGQRMNVALLAHSQEDEHSCFSDNTHVDIAENARGIKNIFSGTYIRSDGSTLKGVSLAQLLATKDKQLSETMQSEFSDTQNKSAAIVEAAVNGEHFDQQIAADNAAGNARVKATIDALRTQTGNIEGMAGALGITNLNPES